MKRIAIVAAAALAGFAGCAKKEETPKLREPVQQQAVRGTRTALLSPTAVLEELEAVGTRRSRKSVVLSSKLMGTIKTLTVRVGDRVAAGQSIAVIEAADLVAQLSKAEAGAREADESLLELERAEAAAARGIEAAQANQALARSTFERFKTLAERGSISRQEFDEVEARLKVSSAETERAREMKNALTAKKSQILARRGQAVADGETVKANLAYAMISSPISGIVVAKPAEAGTLATPGAPLVVIEDEGQYRLEASVDETFLARVKKGDPVRVAIDALGGQELEGRVDELVPTSDSASRTLTVKVALSGQKGLRPGLFGRAFFRGGERQALLVPRAALVNKGQLTGVYVVDSARTVHFTLIRTGADFPAGVEVVSGLSGGETLLVDGLGSVVDGIRLE